MHIKTCLLFFVITLILVSCNFSGSIELSRNTQVDFPNYYIVYKTVDTIIIDGLPNEKSWSRAKWSTSFVDIEGGKNNIPALNTRFKLLWTETNLYVYAQLEEPHIWSKITERDAVVYHDDDFEVFIDPDGDGHNYTEIEINPMNTVWDLFLNAPYGYHSRDKVLWQWDLRTLKTQTFIKGTLNNPRDEDEYWTIEMAIPINALNEFAGDQKAVNGAQWRMNFSRVDWQVEIINGEYHKKVGQDGKPLPENNWVWSPQGRIAMHLPEKWGFIQFSAIEVGTGITEFNKDQDYEIKQSLYTIFHQLKSHYKKNKFFPKKLNDLSKFNFPNCQSKYKFESINHRYELSYKSCKTNRVWVINEEGRLFSRLPS